MRARARVRRGVHSHPDVGLLEGRGQDQRNSRVSPRPGAGGDAREDGRLQPPQPLPGQPPRGPCDDTSPGPSGARGAKVPAGAPGHALTRRAGSEAPARLLRPEAVPAAPPGHATAPRSEDQVF